MYSRCRISMFMKLSIFVARSIFRFARRNMTYTDISDSKHDRSKIELSTRNKYFSLEESILFFLFYTFLILSFLMLEFQIFLSIYDDLNSRIKNLKRTYQFSRHRKSIIFYDISIFMHLCIVQTQLGFPDHSYNTPRAPYAAAVAQSVYYP